MTAREAQLKLFSVRSPERGEPYRCLDCGAISSHGTYGPPGREEVELEAGPVFDADTVYVDLRDSWLCMRHSRTRWAEYMRRRELVPARLRRLRAFRIAAQLGFNGWDRFRVAEGWLRDDTIPEGS